MKKSKIIALTLFLSTLFLSTSFKSNASDLNEEMVVTSALKHYPKIYLNEEKVNLAKAKVEEANGEFDSKFNIKQRQFTSGYYEDHGYLESKIVKPLSIANANIYSGYTRSQNGDYPEVNQYYNTKTNGRAMLGVELSLLRGFLVNERNLINTLAKIDYKIAQYNNQLIQAQIKADAKKAYWKYFYTKQILKVYEDILAVAVYRQDALKQQVKNGDNARIVLQENKRTILRRMSLVENIKRELRNSAVYLSFFLRDSNGEIYDPNLIMEKNIDTAEQISQILKKYQPTDNIQTLTNKRLDVHITQMIIEQYDSKTKLAKNDILPTVDLAFEASKDFGNGPYAKDRTANKVALNITVPIENNKQSGKYNKAKSDTIIAKTELKFLKDSIANEIKITDNKIQELSQVLQNTEGEVEINKQLVNAETIRFQNGDSDFFRLNLREQDLLASMEYNIRNRLALSEVLIEYDFITKDTLLNDKNDK